MKLTGRDSAAYFARPDKAAAGALLYGQDAMRVSLRRTDVLQQLLGEAASEEMRLTRLTGAELRSDPAKLLDAVKASGFFPGPRAVLVEDATDGLSAVFENALAEWQDGDAQIIATAKGLTARSKLRKLFEGSKRAYAIGIYDDPPSRGEIEDTLRQAGLDLPDRAVMSDIDALARLLDPGEFRQVIEKLALLKIGSETPIEQTDIVAVAPVTVDAEIDEILSAVAGADAAQIGPLLARLKGQGVAPVTLCLAAQRHFRALFSASIHPGGPAQGMGSLRPPVFGPRRDQMIRQAQNWGTARLEDALALLLECDLTLRSGGYVPQMAVVERALIRLAMLPRASRR